MGLGKIALYGAVSGILVVSTGDKLIDLSQIGLNLDANWLVSFAVGALGGISSDQVIGRLLRKLSLAEAKEEAFAQIVEEGITLQQRTAEAVVAAKTAEAMLAQVAPSSQVQGLAQESTSSPAGPAMDALLEQQRKTAELLQRLSRIQRAKSVGQVLAADKKA
jgi:hypothetical protein